ncbi:hypothetical protein [Actinoplanes xinjiangensis]|uniref:hypothetical protein n=1 Tax=Actinoplanes xinjiangensis TaxID=512350 RepID=UPI00342F2275
MEARYHSECGLCAMPIQPGQIIGRLPRAQSRYVDPGWICIDCQTASRSPRQPIIRDVAARIYLRWASSKPISLNNAEAEVLAESLLAADTNLTPERRCSATSEATSSTHSSEPWRDWNQPEASIEQVVGYMLDAVHFDFSCNLQTHTVFRLVSHLIAVTCTCGDHVPDELACFYELLSIVSAWNELDWRHPARGRGIADSRSDTRTPICPSCRSAIPGGTARSRRRHKGPEALDRSR